MNAFDTASAQQAAGSRDEHRAARLALLAKEKELNRARDELAAERRRLPWVRLEKNYEFDGPDGRVSMLDLTPKGRDERDLPWTMAWLRRHDSY